MQHSPNDIKEKLLRALDKDNNVVDMATVLEVITILEKTIITKDELEKTRLGRYINELRKKTTNEGLAKRAKDLVRKWRKMVLPTENNVSSVVANGEHHHNSSLSPIISHLPGPGPGHGGLSGGRHKPASPAFLNHHHHHLQQQTHKSFSLSFGGGGRSETSPGNSQCSSAASISPPPTVNSGGTRGRISTDGHFKAISPANSSSKASRCVNTTSPANHSAYRSRSALKRPHDEEESCDAYHPPTTNSSSSPRLVNGVGEADNSVDSVRSLGADSFDCNASSSSVPGRTLSSCGGTKGAGVGKKGRGPSKRVEKCDMLKERLASQLKTSKLKTTAEIMEGLKERSLSGAVRNSPKVSSHTMVDEASLAFTRKVVYSSLLESTDEDVTRSKTELMAKFLNDSAGSSPKPKKPESLHHHHPHQSSGEDPVAAILASLPPLTPDDYKVWNGEENEEETEPKSPPPPQEVNDETIRRLHESNWENVNGNEDRDGVFRSWNEMLIRNSGPEHVIHLLPYVDID